jgi:hypothetical protein
MELKTTLIQRLNQARTSLESALLLVDPTKEIYPKWTLKQLLDHIAGWDDAVITSLRAHNAGKVPGTPADRGIDFYNAQTVSTHESLDLEHTTREFKASRALLKDVLLSMTDEKLTEPLIVPWGSTGTVSEIIEIFAEHEESHAADILQWIKEMDHPIEN